MFMSWVLGLRSVLTFLLSIWGLKAVDLTIGYLLIYTFIIYFSLFSLI